MSAGYDPEHFASLFDVEDRHFWFLARNRALSAVIGNLERDLPSGYRVLEVGCGTGNTLRMLRDSCAGAAVIVGMDLFGEGLRFAQRRLPIPLVQGRIEQPPFRVNFDLVGMFDVLEHISDDLTTLQTIRSLLAPGGRIVLTVPACQRLWSQFDEESHHVRRYEPGQLRACLEQSGYTVEYLTPFMSALYPMVRVSRWVADMARQVRERMGLARRSAVLTNLRVVPLVNEVIALLLRRDAAALARRHELRRGTSLVAVARVR